jgi:aryl-alcohol dehydrogenase-like predicted oxidoreductase
MSVASSNLTRRGFMLAAGAAAMMPAPLMAVPSGIHRRTIPGTGENVPAIGMGTWLTFDVGADSWLRDERAKVLQTFFDLGGAVIDSSPMYGSSEAVIGYCLDRVQNRDALFSATKVWTPGRALGIRQMQHSQYLWGVGRFDLMQIHNLVDWETHMETLADWKEKGDIRYIGVTTSHGRRHGELERIMREQPIDFVQFTYNLVDREAEERLLPLAAERGLAVILNRPFRGGWLFDRYERFPLPEWAVEFDAANWAQFFLKFIISHPAATCAIPATTRVDHMQENMGALQGRLPDPKMRQRMAEYVAGL